MCIDTTRQAINQSKSIIKNEGNLKSQKEQSYLRHEIVKNLKKFSLSWTEEDGWWKDEEWRPKAREERRDSDRGKTRWRGRNKERGGEYVAQKGTERKNANSLQQKVEVIIVGKIYAHKKEGKEKQKKARASKTKQKKELEVPAAASICHMSHLCQLPHVSMASDHLHWITYPPHSISSSTWSKQPYWSPLCLPPIIHADPRTRILQPKKEVKNSEGYHHIDTF